MRNNRIVFYAVLFGAMVTGGLLGGFNYHWAHAGKSPAYGYAVDLLVVPAMAVAILWLRRLKIAQSDEFTVAKKRMAAQTGMIAGFALFAVFSLLPIFLPQSYSALVHQLGDSDDIFAMGRLFGMVPFLLGLCVGQVAAWLKYR